MTKRRVLIVLGLVILTVGYCVLNVLLVVAALFMGDGEGRLATDIQAYELIGRYSGGYPDISGKYHTHTLELRGDGTYVHLFHNSRNVAVENTGTWELSHPSPGTPSSHISIVLRTFLSGDARWDNRFNGPYTMSGGIQRFSNGRIRLVISEDYSYYFTKQRDR